MSKRVIIVWVIAIGVVVFFGIKTTIEIVSSMGA